MNIELYPQTQNKHIIILNSNSSIILTKLQYFNGSVCRIHVKDLLAQGIENGGAKLQTLKYRVVRANKSYCGEIDVGVTFTRKVFFTFNDFVKRVVQSSNNYIES